MDNTDKLSSKAYIGFDRLEDFLRKILAPYLIILLVFILIGGFHQIGFHEGFNIGDWLINYAGGFVRRGLIGEILYGLSRLIGVNPAILLVFLQAVIFGVYFYFAYKILLSKPVILKYTFIIFSPFVFTFAINSQAGGYRKEIIYFAVLSFITYASESYSVVKFQRIFFWTLFLYPMVLLTDELGLVILPLLIGIYWNKVRPSFFQLSPYLPILIVENLLVFGVIILNHKISPFQVDMIINSLIQAGYDPKGSGAIEALSATTTANMKDTFHSVFYGHYFQIYPLALFLCSLAYVPLRNEIKAVFKNKFLMLGYSGSMIVLVPVFIIANDWGRWTYILLVELFMVILIVDKPHHERMNFSQKKMPVPKLVLWSVIVISYASFWYLPHVLEDGANWRAVIHNIPYIRI